MQCITIFFCTVLWIPDLEAFTLQVYCSAIWPVRGPSLPSVALLFQTLTYFLDRVICVWHIAVCWSCHADVPWFVGCGKSSAQSSEYGVGAGIHGGDETKHCTPHQAQVGQFDFGGEKSWEVRGTSTSKREVVALAVSGTKKLWGQAEIKDCILIGELHEGKLVKGDALEENFIGNNKNFDKHQISDLTIVKYRKIYAYVLAHPVRYEIPQPFNYKSGCVIWCSLKDDKESSKKSKCTRATRKRPSCVKKWSGLLDPCVLSRLVGLERIGWEWAKNQHKSDSKS